MYRVVFFGSPEYLSSLPSIWYFSSFLVGIMQKASEFFKNFDRNSGRKSTWLYLLYNPIGCKNVAISSSWALPTAFASGHFDRKSQNRGRATIPFVLFRNMVAEKKREKKVNFLNEIPFYAKRISKKGIELKVRPRGGCYNYSSTSDWMWLQKQ